MQINCQLEIEIENCNFFFEVENKIIDSICYLIVCYSVKKC